MKKKILLMIMVIATVFSITPVLAMTEGELTSKVKATYDINGHKLSVPTKYLNLYDDYVSQFDISSEDCQYIADQIDILVAAARKKNVTSVKDFMEKCSDEIVTACANVSANTGVKATVLADGRVSVSKYNQPNEVFAIVGSHLVVNTGNLSLVFIAGTITLIGAGLLVFKIRKA